MLVTCGVIATFQVVTYPRTSYNEHRLTPVPLAGAYIDFFLGGAAYK